MTRKENVKPMIRVYNNFAWKMLLKTVVKENFSSFFS